MDHSSRSSIIHRFSYRLPGLCESCNVKNAHEKFQVKLNTLSAPWRDIDKTGRGWEIGQSWNDPGSGLVKFITEYLVGSIHSKDLADRVNAIALHQVCCLQGDLRRFTWFWDTSDPTIRYRPENLYTARDIMQKIIDYLIYCKIFTVGPRSRSFLIRDCMPNTGVAAGGGSEVSEGVYASWIEPKKHMMELAGTPRLPHGWH